MILFYLLLNWKKGDHFPMAFAFRKTLYENLSADGLFLAVVNLQNNVSIGTEEGTK